MRKSLPFEVTFVPQSEQRDIQLAERSIQILHKHAAYLAEGTSTVGNGLLDAVRHNAVLTNATISIGLAIRMDSRTQREPSDHRSHHPGPSWSSCGRAKPAALSSCAFVDVVQPIQDRMRLDRTGHWP